MFCFGMNVTISFDDVSWISFVTQMINQTTSDSDAFKLLFHDDAHVYVYVPVAKGLNMEWNT